jgi:hypothetical protein
MDIVTTKHIKSSMDDIVGQKSRSVSDVSDKIEAARTYRGVRAA